MFKFLMVQEKLKICNETPKDKNHEIHVSGNTTIILPYIN